MESIQEQLAVNYSITELPSYTASRCLDRKTGGGDCSVCTEVCPVMAYPEGKRKRPDYKNCIKCGICSAHCPARCIAPPAVRIDRFLMALGKPGELGISCDEDDSTVLSLHVNCLAALSWEQLAIAAVSKGLVISLNACGKCSREGFKGLISETLAQLRAFLGEELFAQKVKILENGAAYVPENTGMSRRDLLQFFRHMPLDEAQQALPDPLIKQESGLFYRAMLRDAVRNAAAAVPEAEAKPRYRMDLPIFTDLCYGCNSCALLCPHKALKFITRGDTLIPTVEPWRCIGCTVCINGCSVHAISKVAPMKVSSLDRVALRKIPLFYCETCGKPRPKDAERGLCFSCLKKAKAAERAAAAKAAKAAAEAEKDAAEAATKQDNTSQTTPGTAGTTA